MDIAQLLGKFGSEPAVSGESGPNLNSIVLHVCRIIRLVDGEIKTTT